MNVVYSDDREYVYVDDTIYSVQNFIIMYGEDALPQEKGENSQISYDFYYDSFLNLLEDIGKFAHAYKLLKNAEAEDNPQVSRVRDKYYQSNDKLAREVSRRRNRCWSAIKILDKESQALGFLPLDEKSQKNLLNFLYQKRRRTYIRRKVRELKSKGQVKSIIEIYNMCVKAQGAR